jgi:hypothetical protein
MMSSVELERCLSSLLPDLVMSSLCVYALDWYPLYPLAASVSFLEG